MNESKLAINGGRRVRQRPLPYRRAFGPAELEMVTGVFRDSWKEGVDFGFQGKYEQMYTDRFCEFQEGGFADAVSSGTAAVYLALSALDIETGSDVIVSPVTDPGSISPVIIGGMNPVVADARPGSYNVGPDEFERALTPHTRAAILTHLGGHAVDIDPILEVADSRGVAIVEDCSQAHGALYRGKRVGRFGAVAAFSAMSSKNHGAGGCGGIVYTQDEDCYWRIRSLADRGKPFSDSELDLKNPSEFLFPALNFNLDELSCAIGFSTLSRLQETMDKRCEISRKIDTALEESSVVFPCQHQPNCTASPFFHTVEVAVDRLKVSKKAFAEAVAAEGIWINPDYRYVVSEWKWLQGKRKACTPNAVEFRDRTFNILFNEQFSDDDVRDVISSILKVESVLAID